MTAIVIPNTSGIYQIKCTANGNIYIGSAVNLYRRHSQHVYTLKTGRHRNKIMQFTFNKYGLITLCFSVLELCSVHELVGREQHYIDTLSPKLNICPVAGNSLGRKHTAATKLKISKINTGKRHAQSDETRRKISKTKTGVPRPDLCKMVDQIDLASGRVVEMHISISDASSKTGINYLNIVRVCNGYMRKSPHGEGLYPARSAGGYGWRFTENRPPPTNMFEDYLCSL